jgi:hypothetical protein
MSVKEEKKLIFISVDNDISFDTANAIGEGLNKLNLPYKFVIVPSSIKLMSKEQVGVMLMDMVNIALETYQTKQK